MSKLSLYAIIYQFNGQKFKNLKTSNAGEGKDLQEVLCWWKCNLEQQLSERIWHCLVRISGRIP